MTNSAAVTDLAESAAFGDGSALAFAQTRILVVEDDRDIAGLVGRELRALGLTVDVIGFAEDALLASRDTDYALMVVDLGLPDRDGMDLVRELRKRSIATPILMMTARGKMGRFVQLVAPGLVEKMALAALKVEARPR